MTRAEAYTLVHQHVYLVGEYNFQAISESDAAMLLGEELMAKLKADPVYRKGPCEGAIYPWNVVSYLMEKE